jgi:glycosyltransferase involved in cell wall biosynthesis
MFLMRKNGRTLNLHIYPHTFEYQSRILKETKSMAEAGIADEVWLVGMWDQGWAEEERIDKQRLIWRVRPRIGGQASSLPVKIARYIEWQFRIFARFRASNIKVINCHSLPVLPIGALLKTYCHAKLVYDTHEVESKTDSAAGMKRLLYEAVEKILIRTVDAVITVSESIAEWYRTSYRLQNIYTVRNIPYRRNEDLPSDSVLKAKFGIGDGEMLFIFQGGLVPGRGIEMLLDIFARLDCKKHVVFMGFGALADKIQHRAQSHPNIHFHDAVSPQDVLRFTSGADVGLCLQENVSLNHYLTIPNKFFEYIASGVPVITSDFPEMSRIIDDAGCGWKVQVDRDACFSLINNLSPQDISIRRDKANKYRQVIGWQEEEKVLLKAYRDLGLSAASELVSSLSLKGV